MLAQQHLRDRYLEYTRAYATAACRGTTAIQTPVKRGQMRAWPSACSRHHISFVRLLRRNRLTSAAAWGEGVWRAWRRSEAGPAAAWARGSGAVAAGAVAAGAVAAGAFAAGA